MINGELSYCRDCGECSTAVMDEQDCYCALCESHDLTDMSDGHKFVPLFREE